MTKTRQQINKEYYEKNKEKVKALVMYNEQKKKDRENEILKYKQEHAMNTGDNYISLHFQHLRYTEKDGKYHCECGGVFRKFDQARHSKTKKHCSFVRQLFCDEYEKYFKGEPNRINELLLERNHVIIKYLYYNLK